MAVNAAAGVFATRPAGMDSTRVVHVLHARACRRSGTVRPLSEYPGGAAQAIRDADQGTRWVRYCGHCLPALQMGRR